MKQSNSFAEYELKQGVLIGRFNVKKIDLDTAVKITQDRHNFAKGKEYPTLVDFRNVLSTTKEARDYFNGETAAKNISSMAILINSEVGKMIASFFIMLKKPAYQTKIFTKEEEAMQWLQSTN
mgnify:CR=1 FL=1